MSKLVFVVPFKNPISAKQRLAPILPQAVRTQLALRLLDSTLRDLARFAPEVDRMIVSDAGHIGSIANDHGAAFLHESTGDGESAAVVRAAVWSLDHGYDAQAVVPADMAQLEEPDVRDLVNAPRPQRSLILCPAVGDDGTNAIITTPPDVIEYRFGARSFAAHRAQAVSAGVTCSIMRLSSFVLDIDTPDDLHAFVDRHPDNSTARWLTDQLALAAL